MLRAGILSIVVMVVVYFFGQQALMGFESAVSRNDVWIRDAQKRSQNSIVDDLFKSAIEHGILYYDPTLDEIVLLTPREYSVLGQRRQPNGGLLVTSGSLRSEPEFTPEVTLNLLWNNRGPGFQLRTILNDFNENRSLIAVRDAGLTVPCTVLRQSSCIDLPWTIALSDFEIGDANVGATVSTQTVAQAAMDPFVFRQLGVLGQAYSNWTIARGRDLQAGQFRLLPKDDALLVGKDSTELVTIDVIGTLGAVSPDAVVTRFCVDDNFSGRQSQRTFRGTQIIPCDNASTAVGARLRLPSAELELGLDVIPVRMPILPMTVRENLRNKTLFVPQNEEELTARLTVRLNDRLRFNCRSDNCELALSTTSRLSRLARDLFQESQIEDTFAAQNQPQEVSAEVEEDARILPVLSQADSRFLNLETPRVYTLTGDAVSLGLAAAIGVPGVTQNSYMGLLENLPAGVEADDLKLTFDPLLQERALAVFRRYLDGGTFPIMQNLLIPGAEAERRAAFTMIDLRPGREQGAVRVALGYPFFDGEVNVFDLQTYARGPEGANPTAAAAWRGLDARFQPGSSIKIISALSLARTINGDTANISLDIRRQLQEAFLGAAPDDYLTMFGLNLGTTQFEFSKSDSVNDGTATVGDRGSPIMPVPAAVNQNCRREGAGVYGVCEALARSSNMWFARMALKENEEILPGLLSDDPRGRRFTGLANTMIALGLNGAHPLVRLPDNIELQSTFAPQIEPPLVPSAPGLENGEPSPSEIPLARLAVAQNAYGQNLQVTPLAMTAAVSSIALGQTVSPFIAQTDASVPPASNQLLTPTGLAGELLDEIRKGLRAVPKAGGTGFNAFQGQGADVAALRDRVSGKTGTALRRILPNGTTEFTHWFIGWIDDAEGRPIYGFGCAISHVSDSGPCGAVTAGILGELQKEGLL